MEAQGDGQLALLQLAHLDERGLRILAEIDELLGVFLQNAASVGENAIARRTIEERLADLQFKFADGLADGRLGAKQFFGGARKAALAGDGEEDFELGKIHRTRSQVSGVRSQVSGVRKFGLSKCQV